jgi:predicted PurR-regulated permease PerM
VKVKLIASQLLMAWNVVALPILLVFGGVIGGLIAFGVIGLFIGPVALAVAYMLLADWVSEGNPSAEQELSAPALDE